MFLSLFISTVTVWRWWPWRWWRWFWSRVWWTLFLFIVFIVLIVQVVVIRRGWSLLLHLFLFPICLLLSSTFTLALIIPSRHRRPIWRIWWHWSSSSITLIYWLRSTTTSISITSFTFSHSISFTISSIIISVMSSSLLSWTWSLSTMMTR